MRNDFMLCECPAPNSELIIRLCNRKSGFGADGIICYEETDNQSVFKVRIFNSDGSEAGFCGNGFSCLALLLKKIFSLKSFEFQTLSGSFFLEINKQEQVHLQIPYFSLIQNKYPFEHKFGKNTYYLIDVGNEHAVFFDKSDYSGVESYFANKELFPDSINIGLADRIDDSNFCLNVIERGCGPTEACTSGALAAGILACELRNEKTPITIRQKGGTCVIDKKDSGKYFAVVKPEFIGRVFYEYEK
jgi:diaminopimelate epimerase